MAGVRRICGAILFRLCWALIAGAITLATAGAQPAPLLTPKTASRPAPGTKYWIAILVGVPKDVEDELHAFCMALDSVAHGRCLYSEMETAEDEACRPKDLKGKLAPYCEALTFIMGDDNEHRGQKKLTLIAREKGAQVWGEIDHEYCGYYQSFKECLDTDLQKKMAAKVGEHDRLCHEPGKTCDVGADRLFHQKP